MRQRFCRIGERYVMVLLLLYLHMKFTEFQTCRRVTRGTDWLMRWVPFPKHLMKLQIWEEKKRIKSKELIWDCNYSPSQGRLICLIRKRSKRQTRGTGTSWIGPKRQPASFCCRQVQTRNSGGSNSRWSQPGSLVWHQSEPHWRPPPLPFCHQEAHTMLSSI